MYVHSIDESDRCMCPIPPVPASFCGLRGTAWYLLAVCASGPSHMQYMQPSWDCYHPNSLWPSWGPLFAGALHCQSQTTCLCPSVASCGLVWLVVRKALGDVSGWWRVQRQEPYKEGNWHILWYAHNDLATEWRKIILDFALLELDVEWSRDILLLQRV